MENVSEENIPDNNDNYIYWASAIIGILFLLFVWAGFLRVWNLGVVSLWIDEGFTINAAQSVQESGTPTLGSGKLYLAHTASIYVTALSMSLGTFDPHNPWQARLPAAIFGILSILATYFFAFTIYKRKDVAILATLLVAFSFWEIAWSRQARGYTQMQFFTILSFGFFILWLHVRKFIHVLLALVFGIFAFFSQSIFIVLTPVYLGLAIISLTEGGYKKKWLFFAVMLAGVFLVCGIFSFISIFSNTISINFLPQYILFLIYTYPILLAFAFIPLCVGFFNEKIRLPALEGTIIIFIPLIILTFFSPTIQMRYLLVLFPFLLIQGAAGLCILVRIFFKRIFSKHILISYILVLGFGFLAFGSYINLLPYTRYQLEIGSPQPAFSSAYQFIKDAKKPSDKVISPYASMTNIYLGEPGLLLPISLSGRSSELAGTTAGGIDYYTGAPALLDLEYFSKMISNDTGFIVLDNMAEDRIRKTYLPLIKTSPNIREVFQKTSGPDKVKVYKFEPLLVEIEKI